VKVYSIGSTTNTQRRKLEKERQVYQKSLEKYWTKHIANVSKITDNIYWNITPNELSFHHPDIHYPIRMTYGFLKTKIDMAGDGGFENWRNSSAFKGHMDSGG
jgi:hypothetical protein